MSYSTILISLQHVDKKHATSFRRAENTVVVTGNAELVEG